MTFGDVLRDQDNAKWWLPYQKSIFGKWITWVDRNKIHSGRFLELLARLEATPAYQRYAKRFDF